MKGFIKRCKKLMCILQSAAIIFGGISICAFADEESRLFTNFKSATMCIGEEKSVRAELYSPNTESLESVQPICVSDNTDVIEIKDEDILVAKEKGYAHINVAYGAYSESITIEVIPNLTRGVRLSETGVSFSAANAVKRISASVIGDDADKTIEWTSDNESVATVADGLITAKKRGVAAIKAKLSGDSDENAAECKVTVGAINANDMFSGVSNTIDDVWQYVYAPKGTNEWTEYDETANSGTADAMWRKSGDTSRNCGFVKSFSQASGTNYDSARVFNAFADGRIKISLFDDEKASLSVTDANCAASFKILKNNEKVFPRDDDYLLLEKKEDGSKIRPFDDMDNKSLYLDVKKGDNIKFVFGAVEGKAKATVYMWYGGFYVSYTDDVAQNALEFADESKVLYVGDEYAPQINSKPDNMDISYYSDDESIVYIDNGVPKAAASGICNLYAFCKDGRLGDRQSLTVIPIPRDDANIKSVSIGRLTDSSIEDIPKGTTVEQIKAAISVQDEATFEIFESDGTTAARELENYCKCIVTAADGVTQKTYTLMLAPETMINRTYIRTEVGSVEKLRATVIPYSNRAVSYESSNSDIAEVDGDGNITAKSEGKARISAVYGDSAKTCVVEVLPKTELGVKLERSGIAFSATGQSEKLEYKIIGAAEDSAVEWKSENESVASVKDGVVTANGTGLTYITAGIKGEASAQTARCTVMVGSLNTDDTFSAVSNTDNDLWQYMYAPKGSSNIWKPFEESSKSDDAENSSWRIAGDNSFVNGLIGMRTMRPGKTTDVARVFNAPSAGTVKIALASNERASLSISDNNVAANFKVLKNDEKIYPTDKDSVYLGAKSQTRVFDELENGALYADVERGDTIKIVCGSDNILPCATIYHWYGGFYVSYINDKSTYGIKFDKDSVSLKEGTMTTIEAKTEGSADSVEYKSSDRGIAEIDLNGHIKAINEGVCRVYAYTKSGEIADYCDVTVTPADLKIGKPVITLNSTEKKLDIKVNVICNYGQKDVTLIGVVRDEKQKAKNIVISDVLTINAGETKELSAEINLDSVSQKADVFIWDSLNGLKPLTGMCTYSLFDN